MGGGEDERDGGDLEVALGEREGRPLEEELHDGPRQPGAHTRDKDADKAEQLVTLRLAGGGGGGGGGVGGVGGLAGRVRRVRRGGRLGGGVLVGRLC